MAKERRDCSLPPSDSDDDDRWTQKSCGYQSKTPSRHSRMMPKQAALEEGEISSDELDEDEDDGLDDNLIGGEDDKKKLEKMSEREREEELFKRAERRDAIQARRLVKQKLKEKRERERAQKSASRESLMESNKRKPSAYANVFSSDSDDGGNGNFSPCVGPKGLQERKIAIERRKEAHTSKFHELIERRKQQAARKRRLISSSEDEQNVRKGGARRSGQCAESDLDRPTPKSSQKKQSMSQRVFSSGASDSSDSSPTGLRPVARRTSFSSFSGSQNSDSSSDQDARGRSRSPEDDTVTSVEQLSRIRLSRFKMEKWVHMPFFDDLVKGCFVRLNIGLHQGVPIYRCAEIIDMVETPKIYDLGDTRTNKGAVVRIGKDQSTFRLAFISNSDFQASEFESWLRRIHAAHMKPPTLNFISEKSAEIAEALSRPIRDEKIVEQIIQSKRRFQRAPVNFAMRKAELIKQREHAESEGDLELLKRVDMELEEIESQAERIDRRRTLGFKSITSINQRNRVLSVKQAEEAIRKESEEALNSKEEDPFTRVHSQPVIVTKKYLEHLRHKRLGTKVADSTEVCTPDKSAISPGGDSYANNTSGLSGCFPVLSTPTLNGTPLPSTSDSISWSLNEDDSNISTPHESLHAIHNFEININLDLDSTNEQGGFGGTNRSGSTRHDPSHSCNAKQPQSQTIYLREVGCNGTSSQLSQLVKPNRRLLNLQEYKKRHGLI